MNGQPVPPGRDGVERSDIVAIDTALDTLVNQPGSAVSFREVVDRFGYEGAVLFYDGLVARFDAADGPAHRQLITRGLYSKGIALHALGRDDEAITAYDQAVVLHRATPDSETRADAARSLYNKATTIGLRGDYDNAISICHEVVATFGDAQEGDARQEAALALVAMAGYLAGTKRRRQAFSVGRELATRYGNDPEPAIREIVNSLNPIRQLASRFSQPTPRTSPD